MKEARLEFIADLGHLLASEGIRHWQGKAAWAPGAPRARIICISPNETLQDLCATNFAPGVVREEVELVRLKFNFGYRLPVHLQGLGLPTGRPLELTCKAADLPSWLPHVAAILLGRVEERCNYAWDPRAAATLTADDQVWFQRLGLISTATLPPVRKSRRFPWRAHGRA